MTHEIGHLLAGRYYGSRMSVPIFIPYIGAIIDMKQPMRNAWEEAVIGISGPLLGTLGACLCWIISGFTHSLYFAELAFFGLCLNLFNLVPLGFLDGGHVAVALTRWLWPVGFIIMGVFVYFVHSPAAILSLVVMLPMVLSLFKKRTRQQRDYDRVSFSKRLIMGTLYFSLVTFLGCSLSWLFIKEIYPKLNERKSSSPMALSANGK
jgi:Zn-dependent protease